MLYNFRVKLFSIPILLFFISFLFSSRVLATYSVDDLDAVELLEKVNMINESKNRCDLNLWDEAPPSTIKSSTSKGLPSKAQAKANLRTMRNCLQNKRIPSNRWVDVQVNTSHTCTAFLGFPLKTTGTKSHYRIAKISTGVAISLDMNFVFAGIPSNRKMVSTKLNRVIACATSFFKRHQLDLRINRTSKPGVAISEMKFTGQPRRSNSRFVSLAKSDALSCSEFVHEIGHHLGLPDRCPDPECPDRDGLSPRDDIMHGGVAIRVDSASIYNRDFKKFLRPLCGG